LRTYRRAPAGGEDCRLRCGGLAVGAVWLIPAPVWQISGQRNASRVTACARDERKLWSYAPTGLLCHCGRLHLAGTKGIQVFSDTARRRHSVGWCHVPWPVSIRAWSKPHPTSRARSSRVALHWQAHPGNLRHPACRLRTPGKISARSRPLTRDRYAPPATSIRILKGKKLGDFPVQAPTLYENGDQSQDRQVLGLDVPPAGACTRRRDHRIVVPWIEGDEKTIAITQCEQPRRPF